MSMFRNRGRHLINKIRVKTVSDVMLRVTDFYNAQRQHQVELAKDACDAAIQAMKRAPVIDHYSSVGDAAIKAIMLLCVSIRLS